ncbi:MAG: inositol monophosphatase [Dehalococcoidia bacterium]|nr:inositol monophosphatase [Dehalococcoidia bacterium]
MSSRPPGLTARTLDCVADAAIVWARQLGEYARDGRRHPLTVEYKDERRRNPVTAVDQAVERQARELVAARFPTHAVLGEEGVADDAASGEPAMIWIVDPIDGTTNFASGLSTWAVSIGVTYRRTPVAGAIYTPAGPDGAPVVYHARVGGGAFCDQTPITVRGNATPEPGALIAVPGLWPMMAAFRKPLSWRSAGEPRVTGSIAVEMAHTAAGVYQYSVFGGPKIWDCAAGIVIVQAAGGMVLERRRHRWSPFTRFAAPRPFWPWRRRPATRALAQWRAPLLCANPALATYVGERLSFRLERLTPLLLRLQRLRRRRPARAPAASKGT